MHMIFKCAPDETGVNRVTIHVRSRKFQHELIEAGLIPRERKRGNSRDHRSNHKRNHKNRRKNNE